MKHIVSDKRNYKVLAELKTPAVLIYGFKDTIIVPHNIPTILKANPESWYGFYQRPGFNDHKEEMTLVDYKERKKVFYKRLQILIFLETMEISK